jgi:hypothetical protein
MISQVRTGEPFIQTGGRGATRGPEGKGQRAKGKGQRAPGQVGKGQRAKGKGHLGRWAAGNGRRERAGSPDHHATQPNPAKQKHNHNQRTKLKQRRGRRTVLHNAASASGSLLVRFAWVMDWGCSVEASTDCFIITICSQSLANGCLRQSNDARA